MSTMKYLDTGEIIWSDTGYQSDAFREHGPCIIRTSGLVYFAQITKLSYSRKNGPSSIHPNGTVNYSTQHGHRHRTDGPAFIFPWGRKAYYVNDQQISPEEFFLKYGKM